MERASAVYFVRANRMTLKFMKWSIIFILGNFWMSSIIRAAVGAIFYYFRDGVVHTADLYLPYKIRCLSILAKCGMLLVKRVFVIVH